MKIEFSDAVFVGNEDGYDYQDILDDLSREETNILSKRQITRLPIK
ncbi:hypothetical protein [Lachnotalea glycerini]|nr:hypothetical protein [Lachnotalea glycerini]